MICTLKIGNSQIALEDSDGIDISIPLSFRSKQLNFFGVSKSSAVAYEQNGFIGKTLHGGGCNVDSISFIHTAI